MRFATNYPQEAEQTKSVNTISIKNDKLYGDTTDGLGLVTDLLTKECEPRK